MHNSSRPGPPRARHDNPVIGMTPIAKAARALRGWLTDRDAQWRLALRVTISAVVTLAVAQTLQLHVPLWAVLTAIILTQLSVGRSLGATADYFVGTIGAALYAGIIGALLQDSGMAWLYVGLALAVAPATLLAALDPRFSAAPFTAVLVFLAPTAAPGPS